MDSAMNSAISALQAQSAALSTVSGNLANSQTTGYKAIATQFNSLLSDQSQGGTSFPAGGVTAVARQNLEAQGLIQSTTTTTDMAINGAGMFPVTYGLSSVQTFYTRNGAFDTDPRGNLVLSGTNYYLEGWPTDTNGKITGVSNPDNIASLQPVNITKYNSSAVATSTYSLQANLPAEAQSTLGTFSYSNAVAATENVTMAYTQIDTTAATATADATTTYLLSVNAPAGQTISDGTTADASGGTQFSQLQYQVTVDDGTIINIVGATPGAATQLPAITGTAGVPAGGGSPAVAPVGVTSFPAFTPSDLGGATLQPDGTYTGGTTPITFPASWSSPPAWSQIQTSLALGFSQQTSMAVYDSLGVQQTFPVTYTAAGNNTWLMTVHSPTDPSGKISTGTLQDSGGSAVTSYSYEISFNADGTLGSITALTTNGTNTAPLTNGQGPELSAIWADGAKVSNGTAAIALNLGTGGPEGTGKTDGLSQFDTGEASPLIAVKSTLQDGVQYGQLTGVSVDSKGDVIAAYDNGQKVPIWKVPVVTFPNENGLTLRNDGVYGQSTLSGNYTLNEAGTNGAGAVEGQSLEASTVNTSVEFSNMITAQQAYSSASQVVKADQQNFQSLIGVIQ